MSKTRKRSRDEKARIARGWDPSACTMREYAHVHGVSERTVRTWRSIYCGGADPAGAARAAVQEAMERLAEILATLDGRREPRSDGTSAGQDPVGTVSKSASAPDSEPVRTESDPPLHVQEDGTPSIPNHDQHAPPPPQPRFDWSL